MLLAAEAIGHLLEERVADVGDSAGAVQRIASGGTVLAPHVVSRLVLRDRRRGGLDGVTEREQDVAGAMAEGRSNAAVAAQLRISEKAVEEHVTSTSTTSGPLPSDHDHRRVPAVLHHLRR